MVWMNERKQVKVDKTISAARDEVITASPDEVTDENNYKLVFVRG